MSVARRRGGVRSAGAPRRPASCGVRGRRWGERPRIRPQHGTSAPAGVHAGGPRESLDVTDASMTQTEPRQEPAAAGAPRAEKPGVLLVNLGTPDAPQTPEVRRYLREFLSDPRVLDINPIGRAARAQPDHPPAPAAQVGGGVPRGLDRGGIPAAGPRADAAGASASASPDAEVVLAMRYGNPSIRSGLEELARRGCDEVVVMPLFPQYASSSTGSAVAKVYEPGGQGLWNTPFVRVVPPFYDHAPLRGGRRRGGAARPRGAAPRPRAVQLSRRPGAPLHEERPHGPALPHDAGLLRRHRRREPPVLQRPLPRHDARGGRRPRPRAGDLVPGVPEPARQDAVAEFPHTDEVVVELGKKGVRSGSRCSAPRSSPTASRPSRRSARAEEDFREAGGETLTLVPSLNGEAVWLDAAAARWPRRSRRPPEEAAQLPARQALPDLSREARHAAPASALEGVPGDLGPHRRGRSPASTHRLHVRASSARGWGTGSPRRSTGETNRTPHRPGLEGACAMRGPPSFVR